MLRTTLNYVGRYGKEMKISYMALHTEIPACTYWNGYLYYSTSALRHFSSPPCPIGGGPETLSCLRNR